MFRFAKFYSDSHFSVQLYDTDTNRANLYFLNYSYYQFQILGYNKFY